MVLNHENILLMVNDLLYGIYMYVNMICSVNTGVTGFILPFYYFVKV